MKLKNTATTLWYIAKAFNKKKESKETKEWLEKNKLWLKKKLKDSGSVENEKK